MIAGHRGRPVPGYGLQRQQQRTAIELAVDHRCRKQRRNVIAVVIDRGRLRIAAAPGVARVATGIDRLRRFSSGVFVGITRVGGRRDMASIHRGASATRAGRHARVAVRAEVAAFGSRVARRRRTRPRRRQQGLVEDAAAACERANRQRSPAKAPRRRRPGPDTGCSAHAGRNYHPSTRTGNPARRGRMPRTALHGLTDDDNAAHTRRRSGSHARQR